MAILQILFVSRSLIPEADIHAAGGSILASVLKLNRERGLTGCLAYSNGFFIQVVEGMPATVDAAMERIAKDTRHTDITVRMRRQLANRSFSQWHMAPVRFVTKALLARDPRMLPPVILLSELMRLADSGERQTGLLRKA